MAVAKFYHLTRDPLEKLLPVLITRALDIGLRVALRGTQSARLEAIDQMLWALDGFLPHGIAGGPQDGDQPVLLTVAGPGPLANAARCLIAVDGAPVTPDEARAMDRLCVVFDGTDAAAVEVARGQWRALTGAGVEAEYWSRDSGRWECKTRHPKA